MKEEELFDQVMHYFEIDQPDNSVFEILKTIPLLYSGWEMDETAWLIEYKGFKHLFGTNHGQLVELIPDELREFVNSYNESIVAINSAIKEYYGE